MKILYAAAAFLLWLPAANAAVPTSSDIGKIENYLNSVKTLTARFVQNASNGNVAENCGLKNRTKSAWNTARRPTC